MKCAMLPLLLTVCLTSAAADSNQGPFGFLFSRCENAEGVAVLGDCVRDLTRDALDRARPKFSTGFEVGNRTVVLEPLTMPKPEEGSRQGRSKGKFEVKNVQLSGLSQLQLNSVMLTDSAVALRIEFPELLGEMDGKVNVFSFIPIRPKVKVQLLKPKLLVGARYDPSSGDLKLESPRAELWLESYNITATGLGSTGTSVARALSENHEQIFEFLKPSLEAAIVRRINKLDQEERNAALGWLESVLG